MNGRLGAIFRNDKQIGGFVDWAVDVRLDESSNRDGDKVHRFISWKLTAPGYWLFNTPDRNTIIRLYIDSKGYWEGIGYINSVTRKIYDTMIHEELEIIGDGVLEGKQ
jgi:uncharacterized Ntn-hydrolase superfamily protein